MYWGIKGTYLLMYLFALPFILEAPVIFSLWIKNQPDYTVIFTRLTLIDLLIHSITYPIGSAMMATGKTKQYCLAYSAFLFLNFPLSLIILLLGVPPYSVMIIVICLTFIAMVAQLFIANLAYFVGLDQIERKIVKAMVLSKIRRNTAQL